MLKSPPQPLRLSWSVTGFYARLTGMEGAEGHRTFDIYRRHAIATICLLATVVPEALQRGKFNQIFEPSHALASSTSGMYLLALSNDHAFVCSSALRSPHYP